MKREIISFRIEPMKHRHHKALFDDDLPFKHKVEKPKKGKRLTAPIGEIAPVKKPGSTPAAGGTAGRASRSPA